MSRGTARAITACCLMLTLGLLVAACGGGGSSGSGGGSGGEGLVIGGWGGAIDEATQKHYVDPYQEEGGPSDIKFVDAPGAQLARVEAQKQTGNVEWDLIDSAPGEDAYLMNARGLLAPLPAKVKSNLENVLGPEKVTDFGFSHANIGNVIVCNMDKMKTCPKTMAEFFDVEKFPESRTMASVKPLIAVTAAEEANGIAPSAIPTTPVDLDAAMATLEKVRPKVKAFFESGDQQLQIMRTGEAEMGLLWSGRAYTLQDEGLNVEINWNQGVYEPSFWTAVKGAPNEKGAFEFMEWIANNPKAEAEWSEELNYSVPNPEALEMLSPELQERQADFPANYKVMAVPNWEWAAEGNHQEELLARYQTYLRG